MNKLIKTALLNGRLVILLGAGASSDSKNKKGEVLPVGWELAKILADKAGIGIAEDDELSDIYASAKNKLGSNGIVKIFEENLKNCQPSSEYKELLKYPIPRIYTLNIDDALDNAALLQSKFVVNIKRRNYPIEDFDTLYSTINIIKLNGDITSPDDGFIFSPSEYGEGSAQEPSWYTELARDFHRFTFLFIGTRIKEPLFQHQIEKYKNRTGEQNTKSYLIIPSLSHAQRDKFSDSNIEFIPGKLADFINWLKEEFEVPPTARDIFLNVRPEAVGILKNEDKKIDPVFDGVIPVSRANLSVTDSKDAINDIKSFYKGFKPTWNDILRAVPARLKGTADFYSDITNEKNKAIQVFLILGSAGTGKTTALKQVGLMLSEKTEYNVYYIHSFKKDIINLVQELDERVNNRYYICVDRIADHSEDIAKIINGKMSNYVVFISSENHRIWNFRGVEHFQNILILTRDFSRISEEDVDPILEKIEKYGNWTRLSKMPVNKRRIEIMKKSKKQLLIGLMEATSGEGYEDIIKRDFESITDDSERTLLLLSGIASMHRMDASESTLVRALSILGLNPNVYELSKKMAGLLYYNNGLVSTRHRIYVEKLMTRFVRKLEIKKIIEAYIESFSVYKFPIVIHVNPQEASIYKGIVNFKFMKKILKDDEGMILDVYKYFEKRLELEGLFLMQYGLALRAYSHHKLSLEKLIQAREAFPESPHIEHAYSQQLLIMAYHTNDETFAMDYLSRAVDALRGIDKINKKEGDRYPLISLSEGHVKIFHKFGYIAEAKKIAKGYYDEIKIKFGKDHNIERIKDAEHFLIKYYSTGKMKSDSLNYD